MSALDILVDAVGGFLEYVLVGFVGLLTLPGKVIVNNRQRSKANKDDLETVVEHLDLNTDGPSRLDRHEDHMAELQQMNARQERYFVGDPDDPSANGLLEDVHEIKQHVREQEGDGDASA